MKVHDSAGMMRNVGLAVLLTGVPMAIPFPAPERAAGECSSYIKFGQPWITCIQETLDANFDCTDDAEAMSPADVGLYCTCRENPFQKGCPPS
jgi:hypothetical protein